MKGGITYWRARKYPLVNRDYYENVDGVLSRKWIEAHECPDPGPHPPDAKENKSYPYTKDTWHRGSFWTCPECGRVMIFRQFGAVSGNRWVYMRESWWLLWMKYHKANRKAVNKTSDVMEMDA